MQAFPQFHIFWGNRKTESWVWWKTKKSSLVSSHWSTNNCHKGHPAPPTPLATTLITLQK